MRFIKQPNLSDIRYEWTCVRLDTCLRLVLIKCHSRSRVNVDNCVHGVSEFDFNERFAFILQGFFEIVQIRKIILFVFVDTHRWCRATIATLRWTCRVRVGFFLFTTEFVEFSSPGFDRPIETTSRHFRVFTRRTRMLTGSRFSIFKSQFFILNKQLSNLPRYLWDIRLICVR